MYVVVVPVGRLTGRQGNTPHLLLLGHDRAANENGFELIKSLLAIRLSQRRPRDWLTWLAIFWFDVHQWMVE